MRFQPLLISIRLEDIFCPHHTMTRCEVGWPTSLAWCLLTMFLWIVWDIDPSAIDGGAFEPTRVVKHDNQTGRYVSVFKAQWSPNTAVVPHWTSGNMRRSIDIYAYNGTLLAQLYDASAITAVPAITASHPKRADRAYGGNGSGKLYVWAPAEASDK